jgi:hypothetical protein
VTAGPIAEAIAAVKQMRASQLEVAQARARRDVAWREARQQLGMGPTTIAAKMTEGLAEAGWSPADIAAVGVRPANVKARVAAVGVEGAA